MSAFDELAAALNHPMVVVTAMSDDGPQGCLVGFHTQCSVRPPRYLVMLSVNNRTHDAAEDTDRVGVSFLADDQFELARLFGEESGDWTDKFDRCDWSSVEGVPIVDGCGAWFVGSVVARHRLGDHTGMVLDPVVADHHGPGPLLVSTEVIGRLDPGHDVGLAE